MELIRSSNKGFTLPEILVVVLMVLLIGEALFAIYIIDLRSFAIVQSYNMMKHKNSLAMGYITRAVKEASWIYTSDKTIEITPGNYTTYTPASERLVLSQRTSAGDYTFYIFELANGGDTTNFDMNKIKRLTYKKRDSNGNILTGYSNETLEIENCIVYSGTTLTDGRVTSYIFTPAANNKSVGIDLVFAKNISRGNRPRLQNYVEQKSQVVIRNE